MPRSVLQLAPSTLLAVAGTFLVFAAILIVTAHVAARNVLGDVSFEDALLVGPVPALVSMIGTGLDVFPLITAGAALIADLGAVERVYDVDRRTAAYVVLVHAVVTVLLLTVGAGLFVFFAGSPPQGPPPTGG